jgi:hypothetical protein
MRFSLLLNCSVAELTIAAACEDLFIPAAADDTLFLVVLMIILPSEYDDIFDRVGSMMAVKLAVAEGSGFEESSALP